MKNHGRCVRELRLNFHSRNCTYVVRYLTSVKVACYIGYVALPVKHSWSARFHDARPPEASTMLELQNLSRSYRGIPAIRDVSFRVAPGEIIGFLGPNGAGKSTTVKIITGLLRPNDGRVLFEGVDIQSDIEGFRAVLGYVPEEAHLYTHLSSLEYLQLVGRLRGMKEALIEVKAKRLLALLNLESWQYSTISSYSKGMKQRVLIAASLMHDPKLLIFDEPLSGLDVVSSRLFKDLLQELSAQGKAVLYISHVLEVVEQICNRVIVIAKGNIVADASPAELTKVMQLASLESVFAQLVQQQDTRVLARELVEVMQIENV
ncbi:MAG TPA: ABC transporter ATP-binding protein [Acidobacteriaceae bacterium]|nr:ABC transporter ATP-binding protein [Acidobacteriaceae bacterium]